MPFRKILTYDWTDSIIYNEKSFHFIRMVFEMRFAILLVLSISIGVAVCDEYLCELYGDDCTSCIANPYCQFCSDPDFVSSCVIIGSGTCSGALINVSSNCPASYPCNTYTDCTDCMGVSGCHWLGAACSTESNWPDVDDCSYVPQIPVVLNGPRQSLDRLICNEEIPVGSLVLTGSVDGGNSPRFEWFGNVDGFFASCSKVAVEVPPQPTFSYTEIETSLYDAMYGGLFVNRTATDAFLATRQFVNSIRDIKLIEFNGTESDFSAGDKVLNTTVFSNFTLNVTQGPSPYYTTYVDYFGDMIEMTVSNSYYATSIGGFSVDENSFMIAFRLNLANYQMEAPNNRFALQYTFNTLLVDDAIIDGNAVYFDRNASKLEYLDYMSYTTGTIPGVLSVDYATAVSPYGGAKTVTFSLELRDLSSISTLVWGNLVKIDTAKAMSTYTSYMQQVENIVGAKEVALIICAIISACVVVTTTIVFASHVLRNRRHQIMEAIPFLKKAGEGAISEAAAEKLEIHDI